MKNHRRVSNINPLSPNSHFPTPSSGRICQGSITTTTPAEFIFVGMQMFTHCNGRKNERPGLGFGIKFESGLYFQSSLPAYYNLTPTTRSLLGFAQCNEISVETEWSSISEIGDVNVGSAVRPAWRLLTVIHGAVVGIFRIVLRAARGNPKLEQGMFC